MGRCLSLFGTMVFTVGIVALASLAKGPSRQQPRLAEEAATPARDCPCQRLIAAASFHVPFSLN